MTAVASRSLLFEIPGERLGVRALFSNRHGRDRGYLRKQIDQTVPVQWNAEGRKPLRAGLRAGRAFALPHPRRFAGTIAPDVVGWEADEIPAG
jgi:hypothetical protein